MIYAGLLAISLQLINVVREDETTLAIVDAKDTLIV